MPLDLINKRNWSRKYHAQFKEYLYKKQKLWRSNNMDKVRAKDRKARIKQTGILRNIIDQYKQRPCVDCQGWFDPCQMDFDHRDPKTKRRAIGQMRGMKYSIKSLMEEIAKCDLVCANCHRLRTKDYFWEINNACH